MNGLYDVMLVLIILGGFAGFVNGIGVYDTMMIPAEPGTPISETQVRSFQSGAESQTANDFSVWEIISMFMKGMGTWINVVFLFGFVVYDVLIQMGVHPVIAGPIGLLIQAPLNFVVISGLYEWWSARSLT